MSLLLLFPNGIAATSSTGTGNPFCNVWVVTTYNGNTFTTSPTGFKDTWDDWGTYQWGMVYDPPDTSNRTWGYMAGDVFSVATWNESAWTIQPLSCGATATLDVGPVIIATDSSGNPVISSSTAGGPPISTGTTGGGGYGLESGGELGGEAGGFIIPE